jgi:hypothetical protein
MSEEIVYEAPPQPVEPTLPEPMEFGSAGQEPVIQETNARSIGEPMIYEGVGESIGDPMDSEGADESLITFEASEGSNDTEDEGGDGGGDGGGDEGGGGDGGGDGGGGGGRKPPVGLSIGKSKEELEMEDEIKKDDLEELRDDMEHKAEEAGEAYDEYREGEEGYKKEGLIDEACDGSKEATEAKEKAEELERQWLEEKKAEEQLLRDLKENEDEMDALSKPHAGKSIGKRLDG